MQIDICCTRKRRAFSRAGVPDPTTHQLGRGGKKRKGGDFATDNNRTSR
jgi:hypothetical protein